MPINIIPRALNTGAGTGLIYKGDSADGIILKSLIAGSNISITNNADDISIAASGSAPTSMTWYQEVNVYLASSTGNDDNISQGSGGVSGSARGWKYDQYDANAIFTTLHEGFAGGQLSFRLIWFYTSNVASADAQQFQTNWKYTQHDGNIEAATHVSVYVSMTPSTGAKRVLISDWQNVTPGGTYAAKSVLSARISREDGNSDPPTMGIVKLKYTVSI